jgi:AmpE protein
MSFAPTTENLKFGCAKLPMALSLLIVAIILLVLAAAPDLARLRNFTWFEVWLKWLNKKLAPNGFWAGGIGLMVAVLPFIIGLAWLNYFLYSIFSGVFGFCLGLAALFYGLGPRDLSEDLTELTHAFQSDQRLHAQRAFGILAPHSLNTAALIAPILVAALKRHFAPVFWFASFGPAGVMGYRLIQLTADSVELRVFLPDGLVKVAIRLEAALAWIPAQLMCVALALASDFDAALRAWHEHHDQHGRGILDLDLGFLASTVKACIDIDDVDELSSGVFAPIDNAPLQHTHALLGRITLTWLVALALLVLAVYLS